MLMRLPTLRGLIRRRLLINYRADPVTVQALLPPVFRPKLHDGHAIAGLCLIRLEGITVAGLPDFLGVTSENAAHRIAVEWDDAARGAMEGVYILRRDTDNWVNHLAGGRLFPGEHHLASFDVDTDEGAMTLSMVAPDHSVDMALSGSTADALPASSCFTSLEESSEFFKAGALGCSATKDANRLDCMRLKTDGWEVSPFAIKTLHSNYFADQAIFPHGSIAFDHALVMKDTRHEWHKEDDLATGGGLS